VFSTSLAVAYFSFIFDQATLKFLWRECMGLLQFHEVLSILMLPTVKKWLLKEFAIDYWLKINWLVSLTEI